MPCIVAIYDNETVFNHDVAQQLKHLTLTKLYPGIETQECVIKGKILKMWPRRETLLKFQLAEDGCLERLNVFLKGSFAEDCNIAAEGDILAMSNVTVESNARPHESASHSCQVIVDSDKSHVWLLKTHQRRHLVVDKPQSGISVTADAPRVVTLKPPGQQLSQTCVNVSTTTSSNKTKMLSSERKYTYTQLKDIQAGTVINVFGVVKFFKLPNKTRGSDYCMMLSLIDPSFDSEHIASGAKLKCLLFARDVTLLPAVMNIGDIVRMHRLKISVFRDELQGMCSVGFSCLVFDGSVGGSLEPASSNASYTLTDSDIDRVKELRSWSHSVGDSSWLCQKSVTTLSDVHVGQYFKLICQIVAKCVMEPNVCMLLSVWDGTKVNGATYEEDIRNEKLTKRLTSDLGLIERAIGYIVDVFVFDDHFEKACLMKPGDFVMFHNLHAMRHKKTDGTNVDSHDIVPIIEFCLHHGNSFGRGLTVLPPDDHRASELKSRLDAIVVADSFSDDDDELFLHAAMSRDEDSHPDSTACDESRQDCERKKMRKRCLETEPDSQNEAVSCQSLSLGDEAWCMTRTATVITSHHHVPHTMLYDVARHTAPYKFRVRCQVYAFHPNVSTAAEFIQLFCPTCHFLSQAACMKYPMITNIRGGVKYYTCPQCLHAKKNLEPGMEPQGVVELKYVYMLRFLMQDETGWLPVCLWREEATKFFHDVEPTHLLVNTAEFLRFKTHLVNMCTEGMKDASAERPTIECCIRAFRTSRGTTYEMFDTTICLDD